MIAIYGDHVCYINKFKIFIEGIPITADVIGGPRGFLRLPETS